MGAGYRQSTDVVAHRIDDNHQVKVHLSNLHLFSSGAFSNVYRGQANTESNLQRMEVVVKKTWSNKTDEGHILTEVQILKMLNRLRHKNIVRLLYVFHTNYTDSFLPMNLYQYLKIHNRVLPLVETKLLGWQLFRGLYHLQRANICHRDIKPQNLLVDAETGILKIGDFGSSTIDPLKRPQPSYHVTRYYRPPELILGSKKYGCEIDIWSGGCVLGEMLKGMILFHGQNTDNQMELIMDCLGAPSNDEVNAMKAQKSKLRSIKPTQKPGPFPRWDAVMARRSVTVPPEGVNLVACILVYGPHKRLQGVQLLSHPFWREIFEPGATRVDGKLIKCITATDLQEALQGDNSMSGSISSHASQ